MSESKQEQDRRINEAQADLAAAIQAVAKKHGLSEDESVGLLNGYMQRYLLSAHFRRLVRCFV